MSLVKLNCIQNFRQLRRSKENGWLQTPALVKIPENSFPGKIQSNGWKNLDRSLELAAPVALALPGSNGIGLLLQREGLAIYTIDKVPQ